MDLAFGRLMKYLEENELDENTMVIFTSDNGSRWDHSNDPLRGEKCFNFEGGVRVPFLIKWDGQIPKEKIITTPGSFCDVLPSIAAITGVNLPTDRKLDGEDISSVFYGEKPDYSRKTPIFFYRYFHDPICMIREVDWCLLGYKNLIPLAESLNEGELANIRPWHFMPNHMDFLIDLEPDKFELYNLKTDPGQQNNLAEKYPERLQKLKDQMLELREEMIEEGGDWFND